MAEPINTPRDAGTYGCSGCEHGSPLLDANSLYVGFRKASKCSEWKQSVQQFEMNLLSEIAGMQSDLREGYVPYGNSKFILRERGKTRVITGEHVRDRTIKHVLCDDILLPSLLPYLIHDSGASIKGKGVAFTRRRLVQHLQEYYRAHGNEGYILLCDYSKYYDNMYHDQLLRVMLSHTDDPVAASVVTGVLWHNRVDVSWMSDEEIEAFMSGVHDSLKYVQIPDELKTGERFAAKGINIGDQVAQIGGISYPMELDNYIKTVRGIRWYARYMDDSYVLHPDREFLLELLEDMTTRAAQMGITINRRKTHIAKISDSWRFMQIQYRLTETGRIVRKINPRNLTKIRHKLLALTEILPRDQVIEIWKTWYGAHRKLMSRQQRYNFLEVRKCIQSN